MKKLKNFAKTLWQDESGQGTAEYVLLVAIVVMLAIMFRDRIKKVVGEKLGQVEGGFSNISTDPNGG